MNPKFKIGDKAYVFHNSVVKRARIKKIIYDSYNLTPLYFLENTKDLKEIGVGWFECAVYKTKKQCLKFAERWFKAEIKHNSLLIHELFNRNEKHSKNLIKVQKQLIFS